MSKRHPIVIAMLLALMFGSLLGRRALAGQVNRNFSTTPTSNLRYWNVQLPAGRPVSIVASVRAAGWDRNGAVAAMVPIRLLVFQGGRQLFDSGPRGGTASYYFRPPVSGSYQIQVIIVAPLGALGRLSIKR